MTLRREGAILLVLGVLSLVPTAWGEQDQADRVMHYYRDGYPVVVRLKKINQANWSDNTGATYKATGNKHTVLLTTPLGGRNVTVEEYRVAYPISEAADQADFVWLSEGEPLLAPSAPGGGSSGAPTGQAAPQPPAPVEILMRSVPTPVRGTLAPQQGLLSVTKWVTVDTNDGQVLVNKDDIVLIRQIKQ